MIRFLSASVAAVLMMSSPAWGADYEDKIQEYSQFLAELRLERKIPSLSVAIARDGEIIFAQGYGWQDHDSEEPTTKDTSYLVASISKTFAAATLLAMAEDGHISLSDDFTDLSDWDGRCAWLTGSGSIFGGGVMDDGTQVAAPQCDVKITIGEVLSHRVNGTPGERFFYNPVIFGRLSNYVEEQTGRSFREWMDEYVIDPGGLTEIAAGWRDPDKGHVLTELAPPFRHVPPEEDEDGFVPSPLPNPELNASSGIIASASALARYSIALDENRILDAALKEKMWTQPIDADGTPAPYAYGWFVEDWRGHRLVWHSGWWPDAYAGTLLKAPDDGWTLVLLGNTDGLWEPKPLNAAGIAESEAVAKFLDLFLSP